ncbi:MAG: lytic transglycosylase domain-containing protein [Planctomycetes bacterium]|nr:lytic transglycosylase domain-containing protein [Planctomycetota bacterium]
MGRRRRNDRGRWIHRVFWLGVLAFVGWFSVERVARPVMASVGYRRVEGYGELIRAAAAEFGLDPNLLAGVALAESSGRPEAVSEAGALGMFQLMLPTARERAALLGLREPEREDLLADPALNARLSAHYLRWLARRYDGDFEAALVAYNAGPGRLDGWIRRHGSYPAWRSESVGESAVLDYARRVLAYRDEFAARGHISPASPADGTARVLASEVPPESLVPEAQSAPVPVPDAHSDVEPDLAPTTLPDRP